MGKKETIKNIYEVDQSNKKHRIKSKKLEKRETKRKNKKKLKETRNKLNKLDKYIQHKFKDQNLRFDSSKLGLDVSKLRKILKKLKKISDTAEKEIPEIIKLLESGSDIDISTLENIKVQKYLSKLLKNLQFNLSPKNPYLFSKNPEFIFSQFIITKSIFEFLNKEKELKLLKEVEEEFLEENQDLPVKSTKESLNERKDELDYEFEYLEEKVGKNTKLINKAYTKILNNIDLLNNQSEKEEEKLVGPPAPEFLKNTLKLIDEDEDDETGQKNESESLEKLINRTSTKKNYINQPKKFKTEPVNKESYYKLVEEEKIRMNLLEAELEEYDNEFRHTSLLVQHQQKKAKEKKIHNMEEFMVRPFDKEKDIIRGSVDSKKVVKIMREDNGLNSRFEAKEKYVGF